LVHFIVRLLYFMKRPLTRVHPILTQGPAVTEDPLLTSAMDAGPAFVYITTGLCVACGIFHAIHRTVGEGKHIQHMSHSEVNIEKGASHIYYIDQYDHQHAGSSRPLADQRDGNMADIRRSLLVKTVYDMKVIGYKNTVLGSLAWYSVVYVSLMMVGILLAILFDQYYDCQVYGFDSQCYYGSYPITGNFTTNSEIFMAYWFFFVGWFGFILYSKNWLRNWCRMSCPLSEADFVWLWKADETEVLTINPTMIVEMLRDLKSRFITEKPGHDQTLPVQYMVDPLPSSYTQFAQDTRS
jgi:hypothetical protein